MFYVLLHSVSCSVVSLKYINKLGAVAHAYNPSIQEAEAGGLSPVRGKPELHGQLKDSLNYKMKPCNQTEPSGRGTTIDMWINAIK